MDKLVHGFSSGCTRNFGYCMCARKEVESFVIYTQCLHKREVEKKKKKGFEEVKHINKRCKLFYLVSSGT